MTLMGVRDTKHIITKCKNLNFENCKIVANIVMNKKKTPVNSEEMYCRQNKINSCIQDWQIYFILERFVSI